MLDLSSISIQNQQRTCVQFESSNTHGDHWTLTLKVHAPQEIKLKQGDDAIISKGDKCIWLKAIRGRHVSRGEGSLFISFCLPSFLFLWVLTLSGIVGSPLISGAMKYECCTKHKHSGERREKVTSEAYHSQGREWGEEGGWRPFTLFYDLWLIFSSVYMNCWAGVWTVAMLLSGLQNRESSVAAQLPKETDWGDVSGGKLSLYLSIK